MEHELTWEMYQPCIDAGICPENSAAGGDEGWGNGDHPVINVSFRDISEHYIPWINSQTGFTYRLPTEVEWEYAAAAGATTYYYWGENAGINFANCAGCGSQWDAKQTAPVKSFAPHNFGLYDMHGNVWELTSNCSTGLNRKGPLNCDRRVIRGGSFVELPHFIGRGAWAAKGIDRKQSIIGFRLVRDI